jgi:hypothetical protein
MKFAAAIVAGLALAPAHAAIVDVIVTGQVAYNQISDEPLGNVAQGADVVMFFQVNSNSYVDDPNSHTRHYIVDPQSFSLSFDSVVQVGLQNPFPNGDTPYFSLVDGATDGFFVHSTTEPFGMRLSQDPYQVRFELGYGADALDSLDIMDARGVYDLDGLLDSRFEIWKLTPSAVVMGLDFQSMTIRTPQETPVPAAAWLLASALLGLAGWRRR